MEFFRYEKIQFLFFDMDPAALSAQAQSISFRNENLLFDWNPAKDAGILKSLSPESIVWKGSLLPSWWLKINREKIYLLRQRLERVLHTNGRGKLDWFYVFISVSWAEEN